MNRINCDNPFVIVFLAGTAASFLVEQLLEFADWRARRRSGDRLPEELSDIPAAACFDEKKLSKIRGYEDAKYFAWIPRAFCAAALSVALVCSGFYPWLFNAVCRLTGVPDGFGSAFLCALLFLFAASVPEEIISVPFRLYQEFGIEKRFGFSKMTFRLWLTDAIKNAAVALVLSSALLAAVIGLLQLFPQGWWLAVALALAAFSVMMQAVYPLVIAPMFNKFTPLEDGALRLRITELMRKAGFKADGIFIMDASRRSGHSNAYFGGLGKSKRIVLYDTLTARLTAEELESVLGHELGHYRLHHIIKRLCVIIPAEIAVLYGFYRCARLSALYTGFGFAVAGEMIRPLQFLGLFLASLVAEPLTTFLSPLVNFGSRRDEYAADRFPPRPPAIPTP